MARLKDLHKFSLKHKIKIASIEDLIAYRLRNEKLVKRISSKIFNLKKVGKFELLTYVNKLNKSKNFVIKKGKINSKKSIRVRVLSSKFNKKKNIIKDKKINKNLRHLSKYANFILIAINSKNIEKSEKESVILRYYGIGAQIIKDLKVKNMILVSRTRKKIIGLEGFGLKIKKQEIIK